MKVLKRGTLIDGTSVRSRASFRSSAGRLDGRPGAMVKVYFAPEGRDGICQAQATAPRRLSSVGPVRTTASLGYREPCGLAIARWGRSFQVGPAVQSAFLQRRSGTNSVTGSTQGSVTSGKLILQA
jgi:hypothetical protein